MNKRIKKLAEQAGQGESFHIPPEFVEKFAELIVVECADVVSNQYSADWGKWSNTMILEHFGVEE